MPFFLLTPERVHRHPNRVNFVAAGSFDTIRAGPAASFPLIPAPRRQWLTWERGEEGVWINSRFMQSYFCGCRGLCRMANSRREFFDASNKIDFSSFMED